MEFPSENPKNILYENLVEFSSVGGQILKLTSLDLHWIPNVEVLDLTNNKIQILHSDTFEYTPKLKFIRLARNNLQKIGLMTFHFMPNLEEVDLAYNNFCTDEKTFNRTEIELLSSDKIKESCKVNDVFHGCEFIEDEYSYVGTATACLYDEDVEANLYEWFGFEEEEYNYYGFLGAPKPVEVFISRSKNYNLTLFKSSHIKAIQAVDHSNSAFLDFSYFNGVPKLRNLVVKLVVFLVFYEFPLINQNLSNLRSITIRDYNGCLDEMFAVNSQIEENLEEARYKCN